MKAILKRLCNQQSLLSSLKVVKRSAEQDLGKRVQNGSGNSPMFPAPLTKLNEDEILLRNTVKKFCDDVIKPHVREMDENSKMDMKIINGLFENGFMGTEVPNKYGGIEWDFFSTILIVEEIAKVDPSVAIMCDVQNTLVLPLILQYGSDEQKSKYLPRIYTDWIGSFCLSEADSGSDAFALKTIAVNDGDYYIINGSKCWITNAEEANFFIVFANADVSKNYKGITAFLVDRNQSGIQIGRKEDKLGIRASSTCPIYFDNLRVSKNSILGEFGKGYKIAIECLNGGRIGIGAQMIGLAQGCFDITIPYLQQRKQFSKRIIDFQGIQHQLSDIATQIEAARLLVYNAARMKQSQIDYVKEAAMAKLYSSIVASNTTNMCLEWMGGTGYTKDNLVEKFYRDCKIEYMKYFLRLGRKYFQSLANSIRFKFKGHSPALSEEISY